MQTINIAVLGCAPQCEAHSPTEPGFNQQRYRERTCRTFLRMLRRFFPVPSGVEARLTVQSQRSLTGVDARAVVVRYDNSPDAREYAKRVAATVPIHWDEVARWELQWFADFDRYSALVHAGAIAAESVPALYRTVLPPDQADLFSNLLVRFEPAREPEPETR